MLVREISPTLLNHNFGEVKRLVRLGYTLVVKNQKQKTILFTINPPNLKAKNDEDEFIDVPLEKDTFIPISTEAEYQQFYENFKQNPEQYNLKPIARFVNP
jgi:hypothetical protein